MPPPPPPPLDLSLAGETVQIAKDLNNFDFRTHEGTYDFVLIYNLLILNYFIFIVIHDISFNSIRNDDRVPYLNLLSNEFPIN
ncbi:hypothetical protein H8356DRAFT_1426970 [Neocallimastix lanati (nom. inval.)]|nr:hypothetical protein H8356DRAFT_1426970 [Neocallimastix sp. JGI-2020a]